MILSLGAAGVLLQATVPPARLTLTYRALDQGAGAAAAVGALSALFALLPMVLAVSAGRLLDRGVVAAATVLGAGAILAATLVAGLGPPGLGTLAVASAALEVGHMLCVASLDLTTSLVSSRAHRDRVLGGYMMIASLGQAVGPLVAGLSQGSTAGRLVPAAGALLPLAAALTLWRTIPRRRVDPAVPAVPIRRLIGTPWLLWVIVTGSLCLTAQGLLLAFLPVVGEARGLAPATIGLLVAGRAAGSILARLAFDCLLRRIGRLPLMAAGAALGGGGLLLAALPGSPWGMGLALAGAGFGLGLALTSSVALTLRLVPAPARGTALALRLTSNRIAQVSIPLLAGLLLAPTGAAGILVVMGGLLLLAPMARRPT